MTADAIKDSFASEARAFIRQWDRLNLVGRKSFADFPDAEAVRPVIAQAQAMSIQDGNPFRDFTDIDLWVIKLADLFLRWCADPGNPRWWDEQFGARWELDSEYPWESSP